MPDDIPRVALRLEDLESDNARRGEFCAIDIGARPHLKGQIVNCLVMGR